MQTIDKIHKYDALGNIYLVCAGKPKDIAALCRKHQTDGVLVGPLPSANGDFAIRIFNPDATEAEISGNGLRIFAQHLHDNGLVTIGKPFTVELITGYCAQCVIWEPFKRIRIAMGKPQYGEKTLQLEGQTLQVYTVDMGNPHCVILTKTLDDRRTKTLGPLLEKHPAFPNKTNVQWMQIVDRHTIAISIWERGAGYTLASGSSSCACAFVATELGFCKSPITVTSPGGALKVELIDGHAFLTGSVERVLN